MLLILQEHIIFEIIKYLNTENLSNFLGFLEKEHNIIYKNIAHSLYAQINNNYKAIKIIKDTFDNINYIRNCTDYMEYKYMIYQSIIEPYYLNTFSKQLIYTYLKRICNEKQKKKYLNLFKIVLRNEVEIPINKNSHLETKYANINIILFNKIINTVIPF